MLIAPFGGLEQKHLTTERTNNKNETIVYQTEKLFNDTLFSTAIVNGANGLINPEFGQNPRIKRATRLTIST
jgi:hypothetical protein